MGKYFGTDGIRGIVGEAIGDVMLDARLAYQTGRAAASVLTSNGTGVNGKKPSVMIAKDTRISGDMLVSALAAGLCSAGANVTILGVLPTPAVAYLTVKNGADIGAVVSASHNPYDHNGIKLFGKNGFKLSDELEARIEALIDDDSGTLKPSVSDLGRVRGNHSFWVGQYVNYLAYMSEGRYRGKVAIDCANGAASETAHELFTKLGVDFEIFYDDPDGVNINNKCGATYLQPLQDLMKTGRFNVGFAFDGDADRCIAVDELGQIVDGDMIIAVLTRAMHESGLLKGGGVVGTIVSNSGMDVFARNNGFCFHRSIVGDRYVLEKMQETGCNIGGESSGHVILSDIATTGDAQLTAIKFLSVLTASGKTVSQLVSDIPSFPQVMPVYKLVGGTEERNAIMSDPRLTEEIQRQEALLGGEGRILVRPSGTEPVIRVLVEAKTTQEASIRAESLIDFIKSL